MFTNYEDPIERFKAQLKPKDVKGLMGEAQLHFALVSQHLVELDYVPMRIQELAQDIVDADLVTAPLGEVIDQFIEWTQEKIDCAGYDDEERVCVALFLALFVKSYLEVADSALLSFEILFKKCYFEYYRRLGYDPDGPVHIPDQMEYTQKMVELGDEFMPTEKRSHIQHLRNEETSLIDQIKQMKIICDDVPAPSPVPMTYARGEDPLAKYFRENLPPEMLADENVKETIDGAEKSGLFKMINEIGSRIEATYTATLPADEREKVCRRIDELVYSAARYNVPVTIENYLRAVFWLANTSPDFNYLFGFGDEPNYWDGFLNEMLWYVDSKRLEGPLGDTWVREVRDMLVQYNTLEEALKEMPSTKYFLRLRDDCGTLKTVDLTKDFLRSVVDAYLKNASEYDVENAYDERCILPRVLKERVEARGEKFKSKGEYFSPVLVYDGRTHEIREDRTFLNLRGVVVVRGIGSVSDYISCMLGSFPSETLLTGTRFDDIRADVHIYDDDDDEYNMPMAPEVLLELEKSVSRHCGVALDDERFDAIRIELARRWIKFKVCFDICEKVPRKPEDKQPLHRL